MRVSFLKAQGTGNDFLVFDLTAEHPEVDWHALAPRLCDRHFGVGADGLLLIAPATQPGAAYRMRVINPDGSEPEMCGNGLRCFVRVLHARGMLTGTTVTVETGAGLRRAEILDAPDGFQVRLDMGLPFDQGRDMLPLPDRRLDVHLVSMGNPHCVSFVDDLERLPFETLGPLVESHVRFRQRTNAEFAQILSRGRIRVKVWERGVGPTLACGTGACATAVAAISRGLSDRNVIVELPGGPLAINWAVGGPVFLTGPAQIVFSGEVDLSAFAPVEA